MTPLGKWKPAHIGDAEWAEMKRLDAERMQQNDLRLKRSQMRMLARGVDDGTGCCRHCATPLGVEIIDGVEHKLHPLDVACVRPRSCTICGATLAHDAVDCWQCSAARAAQQATRRADAQTPIELKPVRKHRSLFGERDDDD